MFDNIKENIRETLTGRTPENDLRARLHADHAEVSTLLDELLASEDYEIALREDIRDQIVVGLTSHAKAEEEVVYSWLAKEAATRSKTQHATREHAEIDRLVHLLKTSDVGDANFLELATELKGTVGHHVQEEENDLLPRAEQDLGTDQLAQLIPQFNARRAELVRELELEADAADTDTLRSPGRDLDNPLGESDSRF